MCGLWGFKTHAGFKSTAEERALRVKVATLLALEMQDRGDKSTGMVTIKGKKTNLLKKAMSATEFVRLPEYKTNLFHADMVIGHTRFPTIGATTDENAHPFQKGTIIGAHNGHVSNWYQKKGDAQVDSEVIFEELSQKKNKFQEVFPTLQGTFAVTWMDAQHTEVLYVVTHNNPFFYVFSPKLKTMFWSSESTPLLIAQEVLLEEKEQVYYPEDDKVMKVSGDLAYKFFPVSFQEYQYAKPAHSTTPSYDWNRAKDVLKGKKQKKNTLLLPPSATTSSQEKIETVIETVSRTTFDYTTVVFCTRCEEKIYTKAEMYYVSDYSKSDFCVECGEDLLKKFPDSYHAKFPVWEEEN